MKWFFITVLLPLHIFSVEPFFALFDPPKGWLISDPSKYEVGVKVTLVASKKRLFTPSLTLSIEKIGSATIEDYTRALEKIYQQDTFLKLGTFETTAGKSHLFQIDRESGWGQIRVLQAITLQKQYAVIQTGVCLKKEFLDYHQLFLKTFKTLHTYPSIEASCPHLSIKEKIDPIRKCWKKLCTTSKDSKETLFASPFFQNNQWKPFVKYVETTLEFQGTSWQFLATNYLRETLFSENSE